MTTYNPHIDAERTAQEVESQGLNLPAAPRTSEEGLPDQYEMKRQQYVSFSPAEAEKINRGIDFVERFRDPNAKRRVTPNSFIKQAAIQKAELVLKQGEH